MERPVIRLASVLVLGAVQCTPAPAPQPIPVDTAAKAAKALRLGALFARELERIEGPGGCVAGALAPPLLLAAADGVEKAAKAPVVPGIAWDVSHCGLDPLAVDAEVREAVQRINEYVPLLLDLTDLEFTNPCAYTYTKAALGVLTDVGDAVVAGALVGSFPEQPLTGGACVAAK